MNNNNYILNNDNPDGIDRRGFLKCMAWAGTGVLWTMSGGVLTSKLLGATAPLVGGDFSFVQISDSHIGFNKEANKDVLGTLKKLPGARVQKDLGFDAVAFSTREADGAPQAEWLAGRSGSNVIIVGDEPLKLKSGDGGHFPADKRLALLKSALNPKPPVQH